LIRYSVPIILSAHKQQCSIITTALLSNRQFIVAIIFAYLNTASGLSGTNNNKYHIAVEKRQAEEVALGWQKPQD